MPCSPLTTEIGWRGRFGGSLGDIAAASDWLEGIAVGLKLSGETTFAMQVCLEEVMSNIARHGKVDRLSTPRSIEAEADDPLSILVDIDVFDDRIFMTIEDNGRPFDLAKAPAKVVDKPLEEVRPGGLGIHLIKTFSRSIEYRRTDAGNRVTLNFRR